MINLPPPWIATAQSFWEKQLYIGNDSPTRDWFHVYAAAMARCKPNLHAEFKSGELPMLLGRQDGSEFVPMNAHRLDTLIRECVCRGLLEKRSGRLCLVLPADHFACELPGSTSPCPTCSKKISRPRKIPNGSPMKESKRAPKKLQVADSPGHSQRSPGERPEFRLNHPRLTVANSAKAAYAQPTPC